MFKILIAEDDRELRQLFQHILLKNGYTVKGVSDGQEALNALEKDYYDLIISDIMMPNMDGYELSVRSEMPEIPFLYLWLPPKMLLMICVWDFCPVRMII